jgi:hypothetical protein
MDMTGALNAWSLTTSGKQSFSQVGMQICDLELAARSPSQSCSRYLSTNRCAKSISCVSGVATIADQPDGRASAVSVLEFSRFAGVVGGRLRDGT